MTPQSVTLFVPKTPPARYAVELGVKTMNRIIIALVSIFISLQSYALGRVVSYDEIKGYLFSTIRTVKTCGSYSQEGVIGEVRLIETYTYGGSMLFLDTIVMGKSGLESYKGTTIQEINNDHLELNIENVTCTDLGKNNIQVTGKVNGSGHEQSVIYNFTINYNAHTGTYKYKQGFNKCKQQAC